MLDDEIDRTIDAVARAMTTGAVDADFRARVMTRLDAPRSGLSWRPAVAVLALAAVVVFAVVVNRHDVRPPQQVRVENEVRPQEQVRHNEEVRLEPDTIRTEVRPAPNATTVRIRPDAARIKPVPIAPSDMDYVAPSIEIPAIAVDGIAAAPPLDVPPLETIPPIVIAPIGDEGDRR